MRLLVLQRCFALLALVAAPAIGERAVFAQRADQGAENAAPRAGDEWPQFLGPNRNGISAATGILSHWPKGGPREVWRVDGGVGMSGLAVAGGRVVTLLQREGKQYVAAFDARTGKRNWEAEAAPEYTNSMGDGPRGTPAIADGAVYAYTGEGVLVALQLSDGRQLWRRQAVVENKGRVADYGMACSPLVVGERVIVTVGAPGPTVVACNRKDGNPAWKAGDDPAGYSSPVLREVAGRRQVVVFSGGSVLGLVPETGKLLWRYPYKTDYQCNIAAPVGYEGKVFISAGENHGCALLAPAPEGDAFSVGEAWTSLGPKSVLRSEWQTPVLLGGMLYGFDNVGSAGPVTHLTCVDIATGKRNWQVPRFGKGNLIAADGKLLMTTFDGEFVLAKASPEGYEEIGRAEVLGPTRQAPSLAGGMLYLRDDRHIVCLDVRQTQGKGNGK